MIRIEYGTVPEFLVKHGYGPDGKNPRDELERARQKLELTRKKKR